MAMRKTAESHNRVMSIDQALAFIQETHQGFLHFDEHRGVDLWSPQHKMPMSLRRAIVKYRQELHALMSQGSVLTCPNRELHKRYSRGQVTCGVCSKISV